MNLSGIAITVQLHAFDETIAQLEQLPGVDVYHCDRASARIVVVQEAASVEAEVAGLKRIKEVPGVIVAELVYHYFADDPSLHRPAATGEQILNQLNRRAGEDQPCP